MKSCGKCGILRDFDSFLETQNTCRFCRNAVVRAWRKKYPDRAAASCKDYQEKNKERIKAQSKARYESNPEYKRKSALKKYGLTIADFDAMLALQGGTCGSCGGPPNGIGAFHVDHDHATGRIRGLLCHRCNTALGLMRESPELLTKLIEYLRPHLKVAA